MMDGTASPKYEYSDFFELDIEEDIPAEVESFVRLVRLGRFTEAFESFELILKENPGAFPVVIEYADALLEQGNYRRLTAYLEEVVESSQSSFREDELVLLRLMKSYAEIHFLGQLRNAICAAQDALEFIHQKSYQLPVSQLPNDIHIIEIYHAIMAFARMRSNWAHTPDSKLPFSDSKTWFRALLDKGLLHEAEKVFRIILVDCDVLEPSSYLTPSELVRLISEPFSNEDREPNLLAALALANGLAQFSFDKFVRSNGSNSKGTTYCLHTKEYLSIAKQIVSELFGSSPRKEDGRLVLQWMLITAEVGTIPERNFVDLGPTLSELEVSAKDLGDFEFQATCLLLLLDFEKPHVMTQLKQLKMHAAGDFSGLAESVTSRILPPVPSDATNWTYFTDNYSNELYEQLDEIFGFSQALSYPPRGKTFDIPLHSWKLASLAERLKKRTIEADKIVPHLPWKQEKEDTDSDTSQILTSIAKSHGVPAPEKAEAAAAAAADIYRSERDTLTKKKNSGIGRSTLETLKEGIENLRKPNYEGKTFVSQRALYKLLDKDMIENALTETDTPAHRLPGIRNAVFFDLRKVFAILILSDDTKDISEFISKSLSDQGLPFDIDQLKTVILPGVAGYKLKKFLELQWEFIPPVFPKKLISQNFTAEIVLPFTKYSIIDGGSFSNMHEVELSNEYCESNVPGSTILVQRTLNSDEVSLEQALEALSIHQYLKHPRIVKMLAFYIHKGKFNLLFRRTDSDLRSLLTGRYQLRDTSVEYLIVELSNLASAISAVHDFVTQTPELIENGGYHDLKPSDILIEGNQLVLYDFGLSILNKPDQRFLLLSEAENYDMSPECRDGETGEQHSEHRSSDIWYFGQIIVKLLTFIIHGPTGVSRYEHRRLKNKEYTGYFPHGFNSWLTKLENDCSRPGTVISLEVCKLFTALVNNMLLIRPEKRPNAAQVQSQLCFIALKNLALEIEKQLSHISGISIQPLIAWQRFKSWHKTITSLAAPLERGLPSTVLLGLPFSKITKELFQLRDQLSSDLENIEKRKQASSTFLSLRYSNERLHEFLPSFARSQADAYFEIQLLKPESEKELGTIASVLKRIPAYRKLAMLAAFKQASIHLVKASSGDRLLNLSSVMLYQEKHELNQKAIGWVPNDKKERENVLIEWISHGEPWNIKGKAFTARLASISSLLESIETPGDLGLLLYSGYYYSPDKSAFGVVFKFPESHSQSILLTLRQVLNDNVNKPFLESRFKLAYELATKVLDFHKLGWIHKDLSSFNIVFFKSRRSLRYSYLEHSYLEHSYLEKPYVVGFVHNRPNDNIAFAEQQPEKSEIYHHPEYTRYKESQFCPQLDWYSLGVVLLELGLWRSIDSRSPAGLQDMLAKLPLLGQTMGTAYRDAVEYCLRAASLGNEDPPETILMNFYDYVVEKLSRCVTVGEN